MLYRVTGGGEERAKEKPPLRTPPVVMISGRSPEGNGLDRCGMLKASIHQRTKNAFFWPFFLRGPSSW